MMRSFPKYRFSQGLSLIELMIAVVIGLLLTAAVMQIFIATKNTYRMQESMARLQENGRFAVNFLDADLRMAGYMGCGNVDKVPVNIIANGLNNNSFSGSVIVEGLNNVSTGNAWGAAPGTDVVIVRKVNSDAMRLTANLASVSSDIQVSSNAAGVKAGDILFISDCLNTDVFKATTVSSGSGPVTIGHTGASNSTVNLTKAYGSDAEVLQFEPVAYFVRDSGRSTPDGAAIRSLYVKRQGGALAESATTTAYELVEGVHDIQIEYGIDTSGDSFADSYVTANNVTNWNNVVSVNFSLLLQGVEGKVLSGSGALTQSLNYNGSAVAADGRLRQVFSNVVTIRNRVP